MIFFLIKTYLKNYYLFIIYIMNQIKVSKSCDSIFENIELVETIDVSILDKLIYPNQ